MIPQGGVLWDENIEMFRQPSRTYKLDVENNRISGFIDELEAVKQATYKILQTERFAHYIYSTDYGSELEGMIGQNRAVVQSELKRRIREALLQDDRITEVTDSTITFDGDGALVRCIVVTLYGSFEVMKEVVGDV